MVTPKETRGLGALCIRRSWTGPVRQLGHRSGPTDVPSYVLSLKRI